MVASRASKVVVLALGVNTMMAQLFYTSAGQLVLGNQVLLGYLLVSAISSTVAFALFEVSTIFQLHDLMTLDSSIKAEIGAEKLIKRGYVVLAMSSLINFLSVLYFLTLAWHTWSGVDAKSPRRSAPALELALLRRPCLGLHGGVVPRRHLWRAAQERQGGHSDHPACLGAASVRALADAEGSTDQPDGARRATARRDRGGQCWRDTRSAAA